MHNYKDDPAMSYLPHFPVIRKVKATAKVIIVFEAAPKTNGICPNDSIHQGPTLQTDLCVVFLSKIHQISSSLGV